MMKSILRSIVGLLVMILLILITVQIYKYNMQIKQIERLPKVNFFTLDSVLYSTNELYEILRPLVIVYYYPECNFCVFEIIELLKYKECMADVHVLFVTFASNNEIRNFIKQYPIHKLKNAKIVSDVNGEFADIFDVKSPPMIFIYDKNKKLIKKHKGIMAFKRLEKYLKQSY